MDYSDGTSIDTLIRNRGGQTNDNMQSQYQGEQYQGMPQKVPYYQGQEGGRQVGQQVMGDLADNITREIDQGNDSEELVLPDFDTIKEEQKKENDSWFNVDKCVIKRFIILVIVYLLLSLDPIKDSISRYVTYLHPDMETGRVSTVGIILYGVILSMVYNTTIFIV